MEPTGSLARLVAWRNDERPDFPFVHVERMLSDQAPHERRGTLFFPSHSIDTYQPTQDFTELARVLVALPDAYQPVTVCMYFRDFLCGDREPFVERISTGPLNRLSIRLTTLSILTISTSQISPDAASANSPISTRCSGSNCNSPT